MVIGGMTQQLRENMILHDFSNLSRIASKATKLEEFIKENEERRRPCFSKGQIMILLIQNTCKEEDDELLGDVINSEIIVGKIYTCPAIKLVKGKEPSCPDSKKGYLFDISCAN